MNRPQTVLITGATSGIGRHTALYLARRGYRVFASGRRQAALDDLHQVAESEDLDLHPLRLDVTDDDSIDQARAEIDQNTGGRGLDVLVNNAGWGLLGPLSELSDADIRRQFDTNVFGLMAVTRAFIPQMRRRRSGRIINVTSIGGRFTFPFFGAYNATKYAVEAMSDALRYELQPFGIKVALIEPGVIDTGFADQSMDSLAPYISDDSPYAAIVERADEIRAQSDRMAVGPECIARAIHRAIRARWPRARYMAPFRARVGYWALRLLPTRLTDWLLRSSTGLTERRLLGHERVAGSAQEFEPDAAT